MEADTPIEDPAIALGRLLARKASLDRRKRSLKHAFEVENALLVQGIAQVEREAEALFDAHGEMAHPYGTLKRSKSVQTVVADQQELLSWARTFFPSALATSTSVTAVCQEGASFDSYGNLVAEVEEPDENGEPSRAFFACPGVIRTTTYVPKLSTTKTTPTNEEED